MILRISDIINDKFRLINGIYVHSDICLDSIIYKYIKKEFFHEMMQKQQLYVANRSSFSDRRERLWKENFKMIFLLTPALSSQDEKRYYMELANKIDEAYSLCISCWTFDKHKGCDESITNWKCYGEDTFRIETTIEDLIYSIRPTDKSIIISPVYYEKSEYDGTVYNAIFKKYISYQDEQEVRMCILSSEQCVRLDIDTSKLIHKVRLSPFFSIEQNKKDKEELKKLYKSLSPLVELSHMYEYQNKDIVPSQNAIP